MFVSSIPIVPRDIVRVRVHPSVTRIPEEAFQSQSKLEEVELCEGLLEIRNAAFYKCTTLKRINIPSSVTRIGCYVFCGCYKLEEVELCEGLLEIGSQAFMDCAALTNIPFPTTLKRIGDQVFAGGAKIRQIRLPDGLESIGRYAFASGIITNFRVPPMIVCTPNGMLSACVAMFSVEISENVATIRTLSFRSCHSLRNIALPPDAETSVVGDEVGGVWDEGVWDECSFYICTDLLQLFNTETHIITLR